MYVIIVGGGNVGAQTARELLAAGHEALIIESDARVVQALNAELGEIAILGDGPEVRVQAEAGMNRADMVIAATGRDETNLAVCQVAKVRFTVPRVIARINHPKNEEIFRVLGVDSTVSATQAIMAHIEQELPSHAMVHLLHLRDSGLELIEVLIPAGAPTIGQPIRALHLPPESLIALVVHPGGRPEVASGETRLEAGAEILAVTRPESGNTLRRVLVGMA